MPNIMALQDFKNERLFDLLLLEKLNKDKSINGLSVQLRRAKAVMSKEDIAYVEKLVDEEVNGAK